MSFVAELCGFVFFVCLGLIFLTGSFLPVLVALPVWGIEFWYQNHDRRQHADALAREWDRNAERYPSLGHPPPSREPGNLPEQTTFAAFEATSGQPIGELTRKQLEFLLQWQAEMPEPDFNDLMILEEQLDNLIEKGADPELIETLRGPIADHHHGIVLRWTLARHLSDEAPSRDL